MKNWLAVLIYALSVFFGAFLLFGVQPLMGKFILPWFGGSPDVWTTCMLFFQVFLLGGYFYAHLVVSRLAVRWQAAVHVLLVAAAIATVGIVPDEAWKPEGTANPILHIMGLLAVCIGLPYFLLSSTGPLMQGWFARTVKDKSPYRLYALSNAGSLLALLSYPFVIEPFFSRHVQAKAWTIGLGVFGFLSICCALLLWLRGSPAPVEDADDPADCDDDSTISLPRRLLWLALAAGSCIVLLAVTNKICQDITVIPFFWVLPLSVYLLSFIICFDSERWYVRSFWAAAFIFSFVGLVAATMFTTEIWAGWYIVIHISALFTCCMVFHGELFAARPATRYLTGYYLMIAAGGALGGLFVVVVAPVIFNTYFELYVGLLMCCVVVVLNDRQAAAGGKKRRVAWVCLITLAGVCGFLMQDIKLGAAGRVIASQRNFFGVLTVWEKKADNPAQRHFVMQHGATNHGLQFSDAAKRHEPTAYYGRKSGVGLAMTHLPQKDNRRVGIVGLGVGTIAAYGRTGDYFTFYEINPEVKRQAETCFTYLDNCRAKVDVVLGDARLSLEGQKPQNFDLLVLDAFTSDAIPVHLLTREAFEIYLQHLKPDGVIALHISTIHVDLQSVVRRLAEHCGLSVAWIEAYRKESKGIFDSDWLIMTKNEEFIGQNAVRSRKSKFHKSIEGVDLWTDDRANLLQVLK